MNNPTVPDNHQPHLRPSTRNPKVKRGCFVFLVVIGIILLGITPYSIHLDREYTEQLLNDRSDASGVAFAFNTAMRTNNDLAYELTDPSLWPTIDEWMATHKVVPCHGLGLEPYMVYAVGLRLEGKTRQSTTFNCTSRQGGYLYWFHVNGIILLEQNPNEWQVTEWENIEEIP